MAKDFKGYIGMTLEDSWLEREQAQEKNEGKTNIVYIVLDDVGYAQLECYGSDIHTPNINKLAAHGLRYNNFHTTAICSATRASLLTGANHHAAGVATVVNHKTGFPNGLGHLNPEYATLAEILKENGYGTYAVGKWHLAEMENMYSQGPYENWPLQKGFDRYYGFLHAYTDQYHPDLVKDNSLVRQPKQPREGYHLSEDLSDHAIDFLFDHTMAYPDKPFFLYLAYGAGHSPHQAPKEYVERYRGVFDDGWDVLREKWFARQKQLGVVPEDAKLNPRNMYAQEWETLTEDEKKVFARYMEVYAGFLEHTDAQIGRVLDFLEQIGELDNTVIVLLSDNGASAEGGFEGRFACDRGMSFTSDEDELKLALEHFDDMGTEFSSQHYPLGWACLGNTPFQWYKTWAHAGGVKDPMIISYPKEITDTGGIRNQYHHVSDITPTVLDIIGIQKPSQIKGVHQQPLQGTSMRYTFADGAAATKKRVQYYEQAGNRGLWKDGWKLVANHLLVDRYEDDVWELYHTDVDYSEADNVADLYPKKVEGLKQTWFREAGKYGVFPLGTGAYVLRTEKQKKADYEKKKLMLNEEHYRYRNIIKPICFGNIKSFHVRSSIVNLRFQYDREAEGILYAIGDRFKGQTLYIKENRLHYVYNFYYTEIERFQSEELSAGELCIRIETRITEGENKVLLFLNETKLFEIKLKRLVHSVEMPFSLKDGLRTSPEPEIELPFEYPHIIEEVEVKVAPFAMNEQKLMEEFYAQD